MPQRESKHLCPLCGEPNDCAMARGAKDNSQCWCRDAVIDPEALARARETGGKSCICRKCATASGKKT